MNRRHILQSAASTLVGAATIRPARARAAGRVHEERRFGDQVARPDGTRLDVTDWGHGKPVVFLHAWALPSPMWDYQRSQLCDHGLRCIAYDRRGHGKSSAPSDGYDCDTLADDLDAVLTGLDLDEVTLVGYSFASAEIVRYLSRHGHGRVARIALIAPAATPFVTRTADNPGGVPAEALEFSRKTMQRDFAGWLEAGKTAFFTEGTSASLQDWVKQLMLTTPLRVAVECHRQITATDFRAELPGIAVPTLVIHGDQDASAPIELTGRPTAALIPKAELRVYEGARHGLFVTHKDRLSAELLAFATA